MAEVEGADNDEALLEVITQRILKDNPKLKLGDKLTSQVCFSLNEGAIVDGSASGVNYEEVKIVKARISVIPDTGRLYNKNFEGKYLHPYKCVPVPMVRGGTETETTIVYSYGLSE